MNKILKFPIVCLILMTMLGCDPGTYMRLETIVNKPIPNDCIENVLLRHNEFQFKKNENISESYLSSYSYWGRDYTGHIVLRKKKDNSIELSIGTFWMGKPYPLEKEEAIESIHRNLYFDLKDSCDQEIIDSEIICVYESFYSRENRCPSDRKQ